MPASGTMSRSPNTTSVPANMTPPMVNQYFYAAFACIKKLID
jgi:hypothetical protein